MKKYSKEELEKFMDMHEEILIEITNREKVKEAIRGA